MFSFADSNPKYGAGRAVYPGTFLLALREALGLLNWQATAWKGLAIECLDKQGNAQHIGLENLYRRVRREPRSRWPEILAEMLSSVPPETAIPPEHLSDVAGQLL